ncbi:MULTISPECIES: hypothetical protein [Haloferax]|uniref:Uncharacterized protein n=2 Tax=Haloferax TaxID=2251 RepID=A0A6G1Z5Q8_9EURY|nr:MULTISPECIES: hypothetical protein [Haloferax]KAB1189074.1 hypothetical protein Hfx1149_13935 [Haloferax sp. CBA1149]MRW81805.1 hypothetical protein [Haloferax marinisediminis]
MPDPTPGPDPAVVGRALAALADPDDTSDRDAFESIIADARAAFSDVSTAAQFLDAGGEVRLRRAVGTATREGHHCARVGRSLLRDLSCLRTSLDSTESTTSSVGDHFHSGRTTVFSGGGEPPDR